MSVADWLFGVLGLPLLLTGGWIQCYRIWRHKVDVGAGVRWATGPGSQVGFHAFLLPGTLGLTLAYLGIALEALRSSLADPPSVLDSAVTTLILAGLASVLIGFWLWRFTWPPFLVPPHLRRASQSHHAEKPQ